MQDCILGDGSVPDGHQSITWTNEDLMSIEPEGTSQIEFLNTIINLS